MVEGWSFGIRPEQIQANVDAARREGAEIVVLLSHNGFDVDQKIASMISGIDLISYITLMTPFRKRLKSKTRCFCRQDHMANILAGSISR